MPSLSKSSYQHRVAQLQDRLLAAQVALREGKRASLAVIVTGIPAAGRSETINQIIDWLDPKFIDVYAYDERTDEEAARPDFWRYWRDLPPRGRIALYFGAWYEEAVQAAVRSRKPLARRRVETIRRTEEMLVREGVHLLKVHLHVAEGIQKKRLKALLTNPLTRWRVSDYDRWGGKHYSRLQQAWRRCRLATDRPLAKWHIVDGSDPQSRNWKSGRLLLTKLESILQTPSAVRGSAGKKSRSTAISVPRTRAALSEDRYERQLKELQSRFAELTRRAAFGNRSAVLVFEGMDAAGKGGVIRRLVRPLDVRQYRIVPVSAPTQEEQLYPYLWRFWRKLPMRSDVVIFDRSWYGRVLVERVRGYAAPSDWRRAYDEINEFERQLTEHEIIVRKFWLAVSPAEQLRRLRERERDPLKRYKVDPEDWVNRRYFAEYQSAAFDMAERTHTRQAPWVIVNADDKRYARLVVLRKACEAIEQVLDE